MQNDVVAKTEWLDGHTFKVTEAGYLNLEAMDEPVWLECGQYVAYDGVGMMLGVFDSLEQAEKAQYDWVDNH